MAKGASQTGSGASPPHSDRAAALRHLCRTDARMARLIRAIGPYELQITPDPFVALVGSIVHQQVSMSAGVAIFRRLREACAANGTRLTPARILALRGSHLRAAGLSRQKVAYIRGIAEAFASRRLTRAGLRRLDDEAVVAAVTELKGVGRWTAEMLLIFSLGRPDVWPIDDLGLRTGIQRLVGRDSLTRAELTALGEPWRPYRTYATWYLWRSLQNPVAPAIAR